MVIIFFVQFHIFFNFMNNVLIIYSQNNLEDDIDTYIEKINENSNYPGDIEINIFK